MVNKAILVGRLGRKPETKYLENGTIITNFQIATDETTKSDKVRQQTEWHNIIAFNKLAEICGEYLDKGSLVYIEGKIKTRTWEGNDGSKKKTTEILAHTMKILSRNKGKDEEGVRMFDPNEEVPSRQSYRNPPGDEELPF